jgi:osmotically-inducible protein OsmY
MLKKILAAVTTLIFSMSLQACMNVATSGAEAVYNRHKIEKNLKDQYLTMQAYKALYFDTDQFKNANITISTYNREMLLAGQAPTSWQKSRAEDVIKKISDIQKLYNLVSIQSPSSSLTRINDAWITTKVKAKFLASNDMDGSQVKVVTENGTVYLMGVLLPEHAAAAVDLARNTDGVQRVIKIFSYMKISKHA